jgi:RNA polymerase sigma factor (sigma-70 family)
MTNDPSPTTGFNDADQSFGSITSQFAQFRDGDSLALGKLWERYFPRMLSLARKSLSGETRFVPDADEVVQKAFVRLWQRTQHGRMDEHFDRHDLWRVLSTLTVQIAQDQARHETAQRRGAGTVRGESALSPDSNTSFQLDRQFSALPAPECDAICEDLLSQLDESLRRIALLKLAGHSNAEIATSQQCHERTIERKLQVIRVVWEEQAANL